LSAMSRDPSRQLGGLEPGIQPVGGEFHTDRGGAASSHLEPCACDPYDNGHERSTPYPASEDSRPVIKP
jgi:hypothetical protein